ncbi:FtsW/RodA/SpoVE family cell cycle protein [Nicoliella spurrieriana]|uniref:Probable peptidoglycan glycosyltransferase FtsW n=1 Tax=Nicoliella spurrieriana TaxID=2925830 RepID=A0A976RRD8_9LACO|nr:FtsW/RodA/SpoVE family cell cycle protein [Nicoliella spurrieriana]UQS86463.1 FtsW/RodA/SpoVE family cell cycle protein [Nicoliella spurrieriana]
MNLKSISRNVDYYLLIPYTILCILGIIMVFSASSNIEMQNGGSAISYLFKQTSYVFFGVAILLIIFRFKNGWLKNKKLLNIVGILFILIFIYLRYFGTSINGSPGWLNIHGFGIQPAEFVKFYFILRFARVLGDDEQRPDVFDGWGTFFKSHLKSMIIFIFIVVMIFLLPDLGGALINVTIVVIMLLASGISYKRSYRWLAGFLAIAFGLLYFLAYGPFQSSNFMKSSYMLQRVVAFANPFSHANGVGQQLVNSYYAISNGGFFGTGIGNSIQKTGYLPEPNTDFIMAIIAEELGLIGVILIMVLLLVLILRIIVIGIRDRSNYNALICYGTATYMVVQSYFNVGGVIGILPITGVTFPFISYGGSSMFTLCLCLGMVLKISYKQNERKLANK